MHVGQEKEIDNVSSLGALRFLTIGFHSDSFLCQIERCIICKMAAQRDDERKTSLTKDKQDLMAVLQKERKKEKTGLEMILLVGKKQ